MRSCSASGAAAGSPEPPSDCQVPRSNWYLPRYWPLADTACGVAARLALGDPLEGGRDAAGGRPSWRPGPSPGRSRAPRAPVGRRRRALRGRPGAAARARPRPRRRPAGRRRRGRRCRPRRGGRGVACASSSTRAPVGDEAAQLGRGGRPTRSTARLDRGAVALELGVQARQALAGGLDLRRRSPASCSLTPRWRRWVSTAVVRSPEDEHDLHQRGRLLRCRGPRSARRAAPARRRGPRRASARPRLVSAMRACSSSARRTAAAWASAASAACASIRSTSASSTRISPRLAPITSPPGAASRLIGGERAHGHGDAGHVRTAARKPVRARGTGPGGWDDSSSKRTSSGEPRTGRPGNRGTVPRVLAAGETRHGRRRDRPIISLRVPSALHSPTQRRPLALVVSDSGLERHRLRSRLRRAGLDAPRPSTRGRPRRSSAARLGRRGLGRATRHEGVARDLLRRTPRCRRSLLVARGPARPRCRASRRSRRGSPTCVPGRRRTARSSSRASGPSRRRSAGGAGAGGRGGAVPRAGRERARPAGAPGARRERSATRRARPARSSPGSPAASSGGARPRSSPRRPSTTRRAARAPRARAATAGWVWLETTTRVLHDASGRVREVHTDSRDVSERVRADAERAARDPRHGGRGRGRRLRPRRRPRRARGRSRSWAPSSAAVVRVPRRRGHGAGRRRARAARRASGWSSPPPARTALVAPVDVEGARGAPRRPRPRSRRAGRPRPPGAARAAGAAGGPRGGELARPGAPRRPRPPPTRSPGSPTTAPSTGASEEECARGARRRRRPRLVLIDLDHFKRVNDTHGHPSATRCCARCRAACATAGAAAT